MKRLYVVLGLLVVASLLPKSASAGPITVVDPIIGVRGGMFGSDPVDSGNNFVFQECPGALDGFVQCVVMSISNSAFSAGITNITLHITSSNPDAEVVFANETESPSGFHFEPLGGGNLLFERIGGGMLTCGEDDHPCGTQPDEDIAFGLNPIIDPENPYNVEDVGALGLSATVTAINDTPLNPVPEPASLLLMGTGIATLAGRRLRRKTS